MKILVITPYFYPHLGGSQSYIVGMYSALKELDPSVKVEILAYNTEKVKTVENYRGFRIYRIGCVEIFRGQLAIPNYLELAKLLRKLKKNRYDVVNSHTRFFENSWWAARAARYLGAKSIFTDHCAYHAVHDSGLVRMFAKMVDMLAFRWFLSGYDQVIAVSKATRKFMKKWGMKNEIEVVYGGVDTRYFGKQSGGRRIPGLSDKLKEDEVVVSFVGRMIPSKGARLLFEVAERIVTKNLNVRFVFAGDGEEYSQLKDQVTNRIHFLGQLSRKKVRDLLVHSDILVHPSSHHEGFPIVLLEAGAAGCAVIATDRGGVGELIVDGKTGLITKANAESVEEKVMELVENKELRKKLAGNLQEKVRREFDWKVMALQYRQVLKQMML